MLICFKESLIFISKRWCFHLDFGTQGTTGHRAERHAAPPSFVAPKRRAIALQAGVTCTRASRPEDLLVYPSPAGSPLCRMAQARATATFPGVARLSPEHTRPGRGGDPTASTRNECAVPEADSNCPQIFALSVLMNTNL